MDIQANVEEEAGDYDEAGDHYEPVPDDSDENSNSDFNFEEEV